MLSIDVLELGTKALFLSGLDEKNKQ